MKRSMHTELSDAHMTRLLKEHEADTDLAQCLGVCQETVQRWKAEVKREEASLEGRLRHLEAENAMLKRLLAEAELDKAALKELIRGNW
jgi:putative transposase